MNPLIVPTISLIVPILFVYKLVGWLVGWLVAFYDISTIVGYLFAHSKMVSSIAI